MKRIVCLVLMMCFIMHLPAVAKTEEAHLNGSFDISLLEVLGITNASELTDDMVTRSDFVRMIIGAADVRCELFGYGEIGFSDVDSSHDNYEYILCAKNLGYISGNPDSNFNPDTPVTANEISKMVMTLLGYSTLCEASGGYPAGYLKYAASEKLFSGVNFNDDTTVSKKECAKIIFNMMNVSLVREIDSGDSVGYRQIEDATLLSENHGIFCDEALVESNEYMSIYSKKGTMDNTLIADGKSYNVKDYKGEIPVGYTCNIYYKEGALAGSRDVIYIGIPDGKNRAYTALADDITDFDGRSAKIDSADFSKKLNIASDASFLYNSQLCSPEDIAKGGYDEILFVDSDADGSIDFVNSKKYTVMHAERINKDSLTVYDSIGRQSHCFDETNEFTTAFFYDGEKTDFHEIQEDMILSVLLPLDTSVWYSKFVYITDEYVDSEITGIDTSSNSLVLEKGTYRASDGLISSLKVGISARFRFDILGRIAFYQDVEDISNYAYIAGIKQAGFGEITVRMFDSDGVLTDVRLPLSVKVNGKKISSANIYSETGLFEDGVLKPQLIEYKLNSACEITSINTAEDITSKRFTEDEKALIDQNIFRLCFDASRARYYTENGIVSFGEKGFLSSDAVLFVVPEDITSADKIHIIKLDKLTHYTWYENIKLYNADEVGCAQIGVISSNFEVTKNEVPFLVSKISEVYNADGDTVCRLYGYRGGYEVQEDFAENVSPESILSDEEPLKIGDVIMPVRNYDGEITDFTRIFNYGVSPYGLLDASSFYVEYVNAFAKVAVPGNAHFVIDYLSGKSTVSTWGMSVYVCETDKDGELTMRAGSYNDLEAGDDVFVRARYMKGRIAVIYKK